MLNLHTACWQGSAVRHDTHRPVKQGIPNTIACLPTCGMLQIAATVHEQHRPAV
jgi:hypothetical protein